MGIGMLLLWMLPIALLVCCSPGRRRVPAARTKRGDPHARFWMRDMRVARSGATNIRHVAPTSKGTARSEPHRGTPVTRRKQ